MALFPEKNSEIVSNFVQPISLRTKRSLSPVNKYFAFPSFAKEKRKLSLASRERSMNVVTTTDSAFKLIQRFVSMIILSFFVGIPLSSD